VNAIYMRVPRPDGVSRNDNPTGAFQGRARVIESEDSPLGDD